VLFYIIDEAHVSLLVVWTSFKPRIVAFMEPVRLLRQADEWLEVLKRRVKLLGDLLVELFLSDVIPPCVIDVYTRHDVRMILERPLDDERQDTVDGSSFTDLNFDVIQAHAKAERINTMIAALRAKSDSPEAITEADLDRPTSLFRCTADSSDCSSAVMNSATALVHRCELESSHLLQSSEFGRKELELVNPLERMRYICTQVKVSGGRATTGLDRRAISRAEKVMTLAGIDLFEGTVAQLDDHDPWVWSPCPYLKSTSSSCRRSHHGSESVFDWRHLVSHEHVRIAQKTDITHPCRYQAIMVLTQIGLVFLTKNTMPLPSKSVMLSNLLC
jgi:hypothetical protein